MALNEDINEILAQLFPHSYHLFEDIDKACGIAKTQNAGYAHIDFAAQGIDLGGKLIVKGIDLDLHLRRSKTK